MQDSEEVRRAAADDEQVPDAVGMAPARVVEKEQDARGVQKTEAPSQPISR